AQAHEGVQDPAHPARIRVAAPRHVLGGLRLLMDDREETQLVRGQKSRGLAIGVQDLPEASDRGVLDGRRLARRSLAGALHADAVRPARAVVASTRAIVAPLVRPRGAMRRRLRPWSARTALLILVQEFQFLGRNPRSVLRVLPHHRPLIRARALRAWMRRPRPVRPWTLGPWTLGARTLRP